MAWTDLSPMEQRLELVTLTRSGEFTVTELSSRFGVSKKTAHKWIARYNAGGAKALDDQSRAPTQSPQKTPDDVERLIVKLKRAHPTWGPKKIRVLLERDHGVGSPPATSTIGEILKRHGLVLRKHSGFTVCPRSSEWTTGRPLPQWGLEG